MKGDYYMEHIKKLRNEIANKKEGLVFAVYGIICIVTVLTVMTSLMSL